MLVRPWTEIGLHGAFILIGDLMTDEVNPHPNRCAFAVASLAIVLGSANRRSLPTEVPREAAWVL